MGKVLKWEVEIEQKNGGYEVESSIDLHTETESDWAAIGYAIANELKVNPITIIALLVGFEKYLDESEAKGWV